MNFARRPLAVALTVVLALLTLVSEHLSTQGQRGRRGLSTVIVDGREAVEGEVIVRYRAAAGVAGRQRAEFEVDSDEVEAIGRRGARRMRSRRLGTRAMLQALRANPDVEYVEPNYIIRLNATPNDPSFPSLWGLFNSGQTIVGTAGVIGADIDAPSAWNFTTGSRANVVGVIDTGILYNHPDLAANIWTAPRPFSVVISGLVINCAAGTHGFNAINNTCNPMDDHSHGTHVAGTIGAVGNNGIGVAGVNWVASMMGLKFLSASGSGTTSDAIKAIEFAIQAKAALGVDANVRVLSNSWGGGGYSLALGNQIEAANGADMLFVAAAGNDGLNNDIYPHYPSSYANNNVVSVLASTNRDQRASFSNYGVTSVDIAAPGSQILSTVLNNSYAFYSGTSMATPHVSGAAALVLSACPMNTTDLKNLLLSSVDLPASLSGWTATGGRLAVNNAVQTCMVGMPSLTAAVQGKTVTATLNNGPGRADDLLGLFCPSTNPDATIADSKYLNGSTTPPASGLSAATVTLTAPAGGQTCQVRMFSTINGNRVKLATSNNVLIPVTPPSLTVNTPSVSAGGTISVSVADGPGGIGDWVALYQQVASDTAYLQWNYLTGTHSKPGLGRTAATLSFTAPTTAGSYELRLFADDGFQRLATSSPIVVAGQPSLTVNDITVTEGSSGSTNAIFTVTLTPADATQTVTVNYATANGTATAGSDYTPVNGMLTFPPSVTTQTISVPVIGDAVVEPNETFYVNLSSAGNATIGDAQGLASILTDDYPAGATITVQSSSVLPGGTINFQIANGPGNRADWIGFFPAAAADNGYQQWFYLNGQKTAPVVGLPNASVQLTAPQAAGTYNIRLFANDGFQKLATSPAITIAAQPTLTINDVSVAEGNSGTATATFTVTLAPANTSQTVTVDFATANGTATIADNDYVATNGTLTFAPNVDTQTINVMVTGDANNESNETFAVNLSNAVNAAVGDTQGTGTITNDDGPPGPSITINTPTVAPGGVISFTVANGPGNRADWVGLAPAAAADMGKIDWIYLNGTRSAPASGIANATLQFIAPATPGSYDVRLFSNDTYTRIARSVAIPVANGPTLTINDVTIVEGNSGVANATFTVTVSPVNATQSVTVDYATANGTATTANNDYAATSGTLTFAPSVVTQTITVPVIGDADVEGNETFVVNLSNAVNAAIADAQGIGTITSDDLPAGPSITIESGLTIPRGGLITLKVWNGPGNVTDWVGLYAFAAADVGYQLQWVYLSGTRTPGAGLSNATLQFVAPMTAGTYNIRLFASDGFTKLATSPAITVTP
ncbi:MAG: S8 family serine peptidase [Cyanobacteria bacterium]|nr:S8 family serine peptidase [Cyanobacteriota bacterium]